MTDDRFPRLSSWRNWYASPRHRDGDIGDDDHIQDDLDLDSMDVLNLVTALHERLGVDIPEADYPEISTARKAAAYLAQASVKT
jgi:acyl carrier protein